MIEEILRENIANVVYNKQLPSPMKVLELEIIYKQALKEQKAEFIKEIKEEQKERKEKCGCISIESCLDCKLDLDDIIKIGELTP